ncbi:MAG: hypothetical protein ACQESG_05560 [Nanobdellota archaeon]
MGFIKGTMKGFVATAALGALVTYADHKDLTDPFMAFVQGKAPVHYTYERSLETIEELTTPDTQKYHPRLVAVAVDVMKDDPTDYEDQILQINNAYTTEGGMEAALKQFEQLDTDIRQEIMTRNQKSYFKEVSESVYNNIKQKLGEINEYMR